MQIDMHYYGTYVLARAAGLDREFATRVATAAQLVDDYDKNMSEPLADGSMLFVHPSAHGVTDFKNLDTNDQRLVWVPFHFLPGGEGKNLSERLLCVKDSKIAIEMLTHHASQPECAYFPELVGIAAHVYADTWSHWGFSGVQSDLNRIVDTTLVPDSELTLEIKAHIVAKHEQQKVKYRKAQQVSVLQRIVSFLRESSRAHFADLFALGHGGAGEYPDRPYLKWSYDWQAGERSPRHMERDNVADFLAACEHLHGFFARIAAGRGKIGTEPFESMRQHVAEIMEYQGKQDERVDLWVQALRQGAPFVTQGEELPEYEGKKMVSAFTALTEASAMQQHPLFPFLLAVEAHRTYVLRDLLPRHGLLVA